MRKIYMLLLLLCTTAIARSQVSVTATGGTLNASYTTLKGAFDAINAGTHTGVIDISLTGNTTETASASLSSGTILPASYSAVTITATIPVVIAGNITGAIIKLNGADNVTIDGRIAGTGRNITVQNTSTSTATAAVWLASVAAGNGCTDNIIRNLELLTGVDPTASSNSTYGIIMCGTAISTSSNGVDNDNNSFIANRIIKCRYGIVTRGTTTDLNQNIMVTDNIIGPAAFGTDQISKVGIFMQSDQGSVVSRNTVQFVGVLDPQAATGSDRVGIAIGTESWSMSPSTITSNTYTVTNNIVHDVVEENTFSAVGLLLATTGSGSPTNNLVANNFIYNVRANGTSIDQTVGLGIAGGHTDKVVFNSIYLSGDVDPGAATATSSFGSGIRIANASGASHANLTLMNNAVYMDLSSSSNPLVRYYAISGPSAAYSFGTGGENNNDYYIGLVNPHRQVGGLGTTSGTTLSTQFFSLANWQTAYAVAQDANSIQEDPGFLSATNLHVLATATGLDAKAVPVAGVTLDIDGDVRNALTPDIGADEYALVAGIDISAITLATPIATGCYSSAEPVSITIRNLSTLTHDFAANPVLVYSDVSGATNQNQNTTINSGTLAPSASMTVVMPAPLNMSTPGTYTFNGGIVVLVGTDVNTANDVLSAVDRIVTAAVPLPETVNFSGYDGTNLDAVFPNWHEAAGATNPTGTSSLWDNQSGLGAVGNITAKINLFSNNRNEWIVGPKFAATANTVLTYDIAITNFDLLTPDPEGMQGTDDKVVVKISTDCGVTWSDLRVYNAANTVGVTNMLQSQNISLAAYAGQSILIAFHASDGPVTNSPDYDFHLDNINISNPSCLPVTLSVSGITPTSATLNWSNVPAVVGYEYAVTTSNIPPAAGTAIAGITVTENALTPGTQYYAHVRSDCGGGNFSTWTTFPFRTPLANDECITATPFPVIPADGTCVTLTNQNTLGGSQSQPACVGSGADDDIWYSFVASASTMFVELTNVSGSTDRVHQVFSGACGSLTSIRCSDPETSTLTGLTIGDTYYVRVHTYSTGNSSVFNICIRTTPPCAPPTSLNASAITSTTATLTWLENGLGTSWDIEIQPSPFTFTGVPTVTGVTNPYTIAGLLPSTGYQFRVRANTCVASWSASSATFTTLGVPPVNDEAPGAIPLVLGSCSGTPYTNANATQSATEPFASCKGTTGLTTVWYSFIAPATGAVKVSNDYAGGSMGDDTRLSLFSATNVNDYSTFTIIGCDDDNGTVKTTRSIVYATGLVPGNTYYIQVDGFSSFSTPGTFCLSVEELTGAMVSTATSCSAGQSLSLMNDSYNGWLSSTDNTGNLIALVRNPGGAGAGTSTYSNSQHINAGPVRSSAGVFYLDRNFLLTNSTVTNADIQFFYLNSELNALIAADPSVTAANLVAVRQAGNTCRSNFSSANGTTQPLAQSVNGLTVDGLARWIQVATPGFSNFYLQKGVGAILPTGLLTFAGQKEGSVNKLRWTTGSEQNNRGFEVQRSTDGVNYFVVGFVNSIAAGGNSNSALDYAFTDATPAGNRQYYRLRQVDTDNQFKYSTVVLIKGDKPVTLSVDGLYPNPANTQVNVLIGAPVRDKITLVVVDMTGKTVVQKVVSVEAGSNTIPVNIATLTNGSYLVKLVCSNCETAVGKFVKQ